MNFRYVMRTLIIGVALMCGVMSQAAVTLPRGAAPCITWAAGDLTRALHAVRIPLETAQVKVAVVPAEQPAEGFSLEIINNLVYVVGGDAVGAMYGVQELTEQINNAAIEEDWAQLLAALKPTKQKPALEIRADNAYIHVNPLSLHDQTMWQGYLDQLARCRYNLLDLHGGYDTETTEFPNLLPMLVTVPEYPNVGVKAEQDVNLADLKAIIAYAKSRGIRVGFMNYSATVPDLPTASLQDYTIKAVARLLRDVPDLYMLGFRVGESGQNEEFFKQAYMRGIDQSGRKNVRLYARSWLAKRENLEVIAGANGGAFDVEIKYNGEQLGLPYQALHGKQGEGANGVPSYSYEDYVRPGVPYRIIWQLRMNGTHRFWTWADTTFIRRTLRTCTFGDARGCSIEPFTAFFPESPSAYYSDQDDIRVYEYMWQKYWMTYFAWGRLAYNPDLPEATFLAEYTRHYGSAGADIYRALQASGPIVDLVCAYRNQGPDHRHYSPETETGCFFPRDDPTPGISRYGGDIREGGPMDRLSFVGIDDFLNHHISHTPDGRIGPIQVAQMLEADAVATRAAVAKVGKLSAGEAGEWRLMKIDLLCTAALAEFHAARIRGVTHWIYALRTGSQADYEKARAYLKDSRDAWKRLADTADPIFVPLSNWLRRQQGYKWESQLSLLEQLDSTDTLLWALREANPQAVPLTFTPQELGVDTGIRVTDMRYTFGRNFVTISCKATAIGTVKGVSLWWKPLPSTYWWQGNGLKLGANGRWSITLPIPKDGMLFMLAAQDDKDQVVNTPSALTDRPYWIIDPLKIPLASSAL
jgi:hypothetical protein